MPVDEHTITLKDTGPVYFRSAPSDGTPPLYLHGIPTSSDDWIPFLERTGGIAPDLIGFGRSAKGGQLDYSLNGLAAFVAELLDQLEVEQVSLVAQGWGAAAAVVFAAQHPGRVQRLALFNPLPLLDGFHWPRLARWWRRPILGELLMGSITRRMLAGALRRGSVEDGAWPEQRLAAVWEQFDQGTQRAILRLHRGATETELEAPLREVELPALIVWGERDPWLGPELANAFAARLTQTALERVEAGHWPWLDRPALVERVAAFLGR